MYSAVARDTCPTVSILIPGPESSNKSCNPPTVFLGRELTREPAATLWAHLAPKPRARKHPGAAHRCGMGEIVNLRRARKRAERQLAERTASANRLRYGRSKDQRDLEAKRDVKARRDLDRHRIETGDER
ncbi:MAG TPA: DUF4169 family protein [Xanthobacteraceae bacterium]|nr:DUF4169 family protein [Xanthobacteraceae bacterium]